MLIQCHYRYNIIIVHYDLLAACLSVPPTLRSSVDGYKTVCPGEKVHFTCSVWDSNSLTWKSTEYIGRNTVIEFNRNFDWLGVGKSTSLPNRETTLLQLASVTDRELKATLRIVIVDSVGNASMECANDIPESMQQTLLLADTWSYHHAIKFYKSCFYFSTDSAPEAPGLQLKNTNVTFYHYISLSAPPNNDRVDIDFYKATAVGNNFNETFVLSKDISKFVIPLLYDQLSQNVTLEVVAVDRCGRESPGAMISIPGKYIISILLPSDSIENALNLAWIDASCNITVVVLNY